MEFTRMGFDLSLMVLVVLGNCALVAIGAGLAAYFRRLIKRWNAAEATSTCLNTCSNVCGYNPVRTIPANLGHYQESHQPLGKPVHVQPPVQAVA